MPRDWISDEERARMGKEARLLHIGASSIDRLAISGIALHGIVFPAVVLGGPARMAAGAALTPPAWRGPRRCYLDKRIEEEALLLAKLDHCIAKALQHIESLPGGVYETL